MEADWEFELGSGAPIIDAEWEGRVDLTAHPERARELPEAAEFPDIANALAYALVRLNAADSPVWTAKCDVWIVDPEETHLDADDLGAPPQSLAAARACYIDLLPRAPRQWDAPSVPDELAPDELAAASRDCVALCAMLQPIPLRCCRADLVIRRAVLRDGADMLGVTAYLTACGPTDVAAGETLAQALHVFADSVSEGWPLGAVS
jgi:hypothetical protein